MTTERFVAKLDAKRGCWIVGDRWSMRIASRHADRIEAEAEARELNRLSRQVHGR